MVKKTIAAIFSVLVLSTLLTACNTTRGVGEDISDGGNAISGAATKAIAISNNGTTAVSCRLFFCDSH
nr:entericidin EcnA/B family [uncultured bacterium]